MSMFSAQLSTLSADVSLVIRVLCPRKPRYRPLTIEKIIACVLVRLPNTLFTIFSVSTLSARVPGRLRHTLLAYVHVFRVHQVMTKKMTPKPTVHVIRMCSRKTAPYAPCMCPYFPRAPGHGAEDGTQANCPRYPHVWQEDCAIRSLHVSTFSACTRRQFGSWWPTQLVTFFARTLGSLNVHPVRINGHIVRNDHGKIRKPTAELQKVE